MFLDTASNEIANANITELSKDVIKEALGALGWNWYHANTDLVLTVVNVPIKLWRLPSFSIKHTVKVSDVKFLFTLLFGVER